jgi:hypothetical protein
MKQRILLVPGCSHSSGSEIDGTEDSQYNRQNSFGGLLSAMLDRKMINIAQPGNVNASIARSIMRWFHEYYDENTMDVNVLVPWTESMRVEAPRKGDDQTDNGASNGSADWFDFTTNWYYRINLGYWGDPNGSEKELFSRFHQFIAENETLIELQSVHYVLLIQNFLKARNIPYLMCNTMHMFTTPEPHLEMYFKLIDTDKYYKMTDNNYSFFWHFRNRGYINLKSKYWHHDEIPHRMYAQDLFNYIGETRCLS